MTSKPTVALTLCPTPPSGVQNSSTTKADGPYCQPFSILGDLCLDMPKMKGCEAYVALCSSSNSQVR